MVSPSRLELAPQFLRILQAVNAPPQRDLLTELRSLAIKHLEMVAPKIPRAIPPRLTEAYAAKGISLEWNLTSYDDAIEFCLTANQHPGLSASEKSAVLLLYFSTRALEEEDSRHMAIQIMTAYIGLDLDTFAVGSRRRAQQAARARKPRLKVGADHNQTTVSAIIENLATSPEFSGHTAPELWNIFLGRLGDFQLDPEESQARDPNRRRVTYDFSENRRAMTFRTFANNLSRARKKKITDTKLA